MTITDGMAGRLSSALVVLTAESSVTSVPMLANSRLPNMNIATFTPYFSRIRSASPRRVTMRQAHAHFLRYAQQDGDE